MEHMNVDAEAIYDEQISPLMTQIIAICKKHRIPMLCSFQYSDESDPNGAGFCTSRIPFKGESLSLRLATEELYRKSSFMAITVSTPKV